MKSNGRAGYVVKKVLKGLQGVFISNAWRKRVFYLRHEYPGEISVRSDHVILELLGLTLRQDSFAFVLDSYNLIRELHHSRSVRFYFENERLLVDIGGIIINPTTAEEFFILHEVFVNGAYNFDFPGTCVVVDVGMNVGVASLFFASLQHVEKVFAFEPFRPTFSQATVNMDYNKNLSGRIVFENVGLGDKDQSIEVIYDYVNKGQVGIHGTDLVRSDLTRVEKQKIEIRDASAILRKIVEEFPGRPLVLKLDCEGSEYAILQNLFDNNVLGVFKIVFIEWHERGPQPLLTWLRGCGFVSFYQQTSWRVGMIYAVK